MQDKEQSQEMFSNFVGKFVKIIYNDLGKPHISRGVLKKVNSNFIYIKGDYSEQIISIKEIIRINAVGDRND